MARGLTDQFMRDLKDGILHPILDRVLKDDTLDLQIRNNYVNVYYRGGNLMKITDPNPTIGTYKAYFNNKYFMGSSPAACLKTTIIKNQVDSDSWVKEFPILKQAMDLYFSQHAKEEREFQQLIGRENNWSGIANDTDYFICDIEYANAATKALINAAINVSDQVETEGEITEATDDITDEATPDAIEEAISKGFRFDMAAVCWPSTSQDHMNQDGHRLAIIEVKYGVGAISGKASLLTHFKDVSMFARDSVKLNAFKEEMVNVYQQKHKLKLIKSPHELKSFNNQKKPEFIILLINYKNKVGTLKKEIIAMENWMNAQASIEVELKFAVSNFMGYGLYKDGVYDLKEFKEFLGIGCQKDQSEEERPLEN